MSKILVIDPCEKSSAYISEEIKKEFKVDVLTSSSLKETRRIIDSTEGISVAIIDPILNDDTNLKAIDLIIENDIPVVVYSSYSKPDLLDKIVNKQIVDYLIKPSRENCFILVNLISNILRHQQTAILVIDDSNTAIMHINDMLSNLNLLILEAKSAQEGLQKLKEYPEIKLILADYSMEESNGVELTAEIRKRYSNKEVAIIGHSAYGSPVLSAEFLKNGANDFIKKPFLKEEFIHRVLIQLDMIDYIEIIKESSEKDFLTSIYNRKYVYEVGRKLFDNAKRGNITMACAMIDIDHFKKINDNYGHEVGDKVIIRLAKELSSSFRKSDIVGRLGGEEFCVVMTNPDVDNLESIFDNLRKSIENIDMEAEDSVGDKLKFNFTVSIGVTSVLADSFEEMLKFSDMKLYEAKNYGRNMVVL